MMPACIHRSLEAVIRRDTDLAPASEAAVAVGIAVAGGSGLDGKLCLLGRVLPGVLGVPTRYRFFIRPKQRHTASVSQQVNHDVRTYFRAGCACCRFLRCSLECAIGHNRARPTVDRSLCVDVEALSDVCREYNLSPFRIRQRTNLVF